MPNTETLFAFLTATAAFAYARGPTLLYAAPKHYAPEKPTACIRC